MKKWQVTDIRWATFDDLELPFWKKWNKENSLPDGFWQRIWEYPYAALHVPKAEGTIDIGGTYPFVLFPNWPEAISADIRDLNKEDHPYLKGKWPKGKLMIADATKIPVKNNSYNYAFSISAIEEMPNTVKVLKEMIRIAKQRVVVTMDVSEELGVNRTLMRELETYLGISLPPIPHNVLRSNDPRLRTFGQPVAPDFKHIRVLGLVIDAIDEPKDVGILIPHWESYPFADACLRGILAQRNKNVKEHIYLLDDYSQDGSFQRLKKKYVKNKDITFLRINRPDRATNPDVGALLDKGLEYVEEQFVVMLDADTIPLTKDWISFPLWLLEKNHASSVGLDTGLSSAYAKQGGNFENWWQPETGYSIRGGLYDNNWFTVTNNLYRIMRTATAKVISQSIGFTRGHIQGTSKASRVVKYGMNKLGLYKPEPDPRLPYLPVGCDNGVAANHFVDINRMGGKFNLPLTSYIGLTEKDGAYGQNISGLLFHFALSTRALSKTRREVLDPGAEYVKWIDQINKQGMISPQLEREMIKKSTIFKPGGYDGSIPTKWYTTEAKYMQDLLAQFHKRKAK